MSEVASVITKTCTKCGVEKPLDQFGPRKEGLHGRRSACRPCDCQKHKRWVSRNTERFKAIQRETKRRAYRRDPDKHKARVNVRKQMERLPQWALVCEIDRLYREAQRQGRLTGEPHQVDHVYPVRGKTVCGLSVATNMRVVTKTLNYRKKNLLPGFLAHELWDPSAPEVFHE